MIREIYTRDPNDPQYEEGMFETQGALDEILAKVRMLLGTTNGEVLGEYKLGINIESLVFKSAKNNAAIEMEINKQIGEYINGLDKYRLESRVKFGHHKDGYDYAVIDILVNDKRIQSYLVD